MSLIKRIRTFIYRKDKNRCSFCGKNLSETEKKYYNNSCEKCESRLYKNIKVKYDKKPKGDCKWRLRLDR